ncbi:liprin-beta-2 isoform X5 [Tachysurus ichikawai]
MYDKCTAVKITFRPELLSRTTFESQKLSLMDEVSSLNLKLVNMEERQSPSTERQHKAEVLYCRRRWNKPLGLGRGSYACL